MQHLTFAFQSLFNTWKRKKWSPKAVGEIYSETKRSKHSLDIRKWCWSKLRVTGRGTLLCARASILHPRTSRKVRMHSVSGYRQFDSQSFLWKQRSRSIRFAYRRVRSKMATDKCQACYTNYRQSKHGLYSRCISQLSIHVYVIPEVQDFYWCMDKASGAEVFPDNLNPNRVYS